MYFVGGAGCDSTADKVKNFISKYICKTGILEVEELKIRTQSAKAYKVKFESRYETEFKNPSLWPEGINIQRYSFLLEKMRNQFQLGPQIT